jgi:putative ABC transport system substrate-binding protein
MARESEGWEPVIGFLHLTSRDETRAYLPHFKKGLADRGYIEGKNVAIEYRWGQVSVIVTLESTLAALAAKEATRTIPVIFMQGADPVRIGLVDSLSHPDGNLTGINLFLAEYSLVTSIRPSPNLIEEYFRGASLSLRMSTHSSE